ncbi:MAG: NAD(P)-dependent oxidoreductase [Rothia sp. (in: high G+C Gram-positive bacteria)]|nr:NAD(P)-dependent oxidoreductase [Rothia sp. (in: high G+C Gram-positive bacteria)]
MKILAPTSIELDESKLGLQADDELVAYDPQANLPEDTYDADVMIIWANSSEQLADAAKNLHSVKLLQALLAGPDQVRGAGFRSEAVITSGVGLHSLTVAEHTLALALNFVRFLPTLAKAQEDNRWASELGGAQELYPKDQLTTLLNANVLIWGFGSIGQETARLFDAFGAHVTGVARSAGMRGGFPVITDEQLREYLPKTDVLVMVLPASEETKDSLNIEVLKQLPSRAFIINVGRGVTVNEADLIDALNKNEIAGAALDVVSEEPLPSDNPLWNVPNLVITPHAAGGRPVNPEELIAQNITALRANVAGDETQYRNKMN